MRTYENFQWNWILILGLGAVVLILSTRLNDPVTPKLPFLVSMLIQILLILIPLMFYGMKTIIDDEEIRLRYGIGIIQIKIKLSDIESAEVVRNPWYYGIGIRIIPHGLLYNAHGLDAVELRFKNKRKIIRIGSGEPIILKHEIEKRLKYP